MQMAEVSIVYSKYETWALKLLNNTPLLLAVLFWLAGIVPLWTCCLVLLGAGALQLINENSTLNFHTIISQNQT
jgi:bacteriorhodopsin